jgi:peptidoglycan/xylan/chitin deacetylase (PgdA/CDA1 family)
MTESPLAGTMDNPYYDWSPIHTRPTLRWPDGARIAFGVVLTLESLDWYPPPDVVVPPTVKSLRPHAYPAIPDVHATSQYEYGNRVGVFRIMDVLQRYGVTPMVAMDATVAERSPFLVEYLSQRGVEFVGHGPSADRMITEAMPEAEEAELIQDSLDRLIAATGAMPRGWVGSEYGESSRTVRLLAEQGLDYVLDWPNDEQPHRMKVPVGRMVNLPVMIELDDLLTHVTRFIAVQRFSRMIIEQFDRLYDDAATTGRLFLLPVRPWIMGQPFRIKYFDEAIAAIVGRREVWAATGGAIVDAYLESSAALQ